jgi:hypothetical protein
MEEGLCLILGAVGCGPSCWCQKASAQQIEFGSAVHLVLHEFEFGDLPFGLAVRPRLDQRRHHRGKIGPDAVAK